MKFTLQFVLLWTLFIIPHRTFSDSYDCGSNLCRRLPQAIIIGVKKAGTRALLEYLRLHPNVKAPGPETHFFDRFYHRGLDWYRNAMPLTTDKEITIEKTPGYFTKAQVPGRIRQMSDKVKLLVVVRDPVTRAISDYTQMRTKRAEPRTFEQLAFLNLTSGTVNSNWPALKLGQYVRHMDKWLAQIDLSQIHFVSGENLITNPVQEMQMVEQFLHLNPYINEDHFRFNRTKGFPCIKKSPRADAYHCLGHTKGRKHPFVAVEHRARLYEFFKPDNEAFYRLVGRNFGWNLTAYH